MIGVLVKQVTCGILVYVIPIDKNLHIKNCACKKRLFNILVLDTKYFLRKRLGKFQSMIEFVCLEELMLIKPMNHSGVLLVIIIDFLR